ncbi:MAG: N-acetyltransferase [Acidimicrobiales bacterium]|jgi:putative acetyltransferase|nr:N-acetyltransferase [Acidimicrobiales bacterium]
MQIRAESPTDHSEIAGLVATAFGSTLQADLVDRIRRSPEFVGSMALVADDAGQLFGHVMVSHAVLRHAAGERSIGMLSPLAVVPDRQLAGLGAALVGAVLDVAEQRDEPLVVLEGNPAYSGRFGFEPARRHGIEIPLPDWAPPDAAQFKLLATYDSTDETLRGTVIHPAAFDGLD